MEVIVKQIGTMRNGNTYILLNSTVKSTFGTQVMSAFITVTETELVEGAVLQLTTKEYNSIDWKA